MPRTDANRRGCDAAARQRRSRNDAPANSEIATSAQDALSAGNSLADLAARIRAEREAAGRALSDGLRHAVAAGALLIDAKQQIGKHGAWLPWLAENCSLPERTVQVYMRVARSFESKAQQTDNGEKPDAAPPPAPPAAAAERGTSVIPVEGSA